MTSNNHDLDSSRLVGVIDMRQGKAVHAVAGRRSQYREVEFCEGDAVSLARYYLHLGLSKLYVADLDAIGGDPIQQAALESVLGLGFHETLIDVGWRDAQERNRRDALQRISRRFPSTLWIAATESCSRITALAELAQCVGPSRVLLGLDFRGGELLSSGPSQQQWLSTVASIGGVGVVVLDVAAVGTKRGPVTMETCQRLQVKWPELRLYSGGGVRETQDIHRLLDAGCDGVLIATALHPKA